MWFQSFCPLQSFVNLLRLRNLQSAGNLVGHSSLLTQCIASNFYVEDKRWRSWLRHCATDRKVAGSIPYDVNGIFHWRNPSSCTMAVRSTQECVPGVMAAGAQVWQPYHLHVPIILKSGSLNVLSKPSCPTTTWETFMPWWPRVTYILTRQNQSIYITRFNLIWNVIFVPLLGTIACVKLTVFLYSSFTNRCIFIKTLITIYIKIRRILHVSVYDRHQGACNWAWLRLYWY